MNKLMKSIIAVVSIAGIIGISSCHRQTCPTYTKAESSVKEVRA